MFLLLLMSFQETKDRLFRNGGGKEKFILLLSSILYTTSACSLPDHKGGSGFKSMMSSNNSVLYPKQHLLLASSHSHRSLNGIGYFIVWNNPSLWLLDSSSSNIKSHVMRYIYIVLMSWEQYIIVLSCISYIYMCI